MSILEEWESEWKRGWIERGERAIARAAILLDHISPGWAKRINTAKLNLTSGEWCLLAQAFAAPWYKPWGWGRPYLRGRKAMQAGGIDPPQGIFVNNDFLPAWQAEIHKRVA